MLQHDLTLAVPESVRYERITLADEENAFSCWERAIAAYLAPTFPLAWFDRLESNPDDPWPLPLERGERETLRAWAESNRGVIDLLEEGAARRKFQWPRCAAHWSERNDVLYPSLQLRQLARLRCIRARLAADDGASPFAADELHKTLTMLGLMARGEGTWTESLLVMLSIRETVDAVRHLVGQFDLPAEARRQLITSLQELPSFEHCMQLGVRVELCNEQLHDLNRLPDHASVAELIEPLLTYHYSALKTLDMAATLCEQPLLDREIVAQRLEQRRFQLLRLLADHPRPFDKLATARLMGERAAIDLQRLSGAAPSTRSRRFDQLSAYLFPDSSQRLARAWPQMLTPNFPLDMFGDDEAARRERASMHSGMPLLQRWRLSRDFKSLTDERLERYARRLRAIDNPIGKLIAERTISMEALRASTDECTAKVARAIKGLNGDWRTRTTTLAVH